MELEIKVMWCKGLTAFNFFQKLTLYAAVSITPTGCDKLKLTDDQKQEQKTPVDNSGDGNPEWNYSMKFDLRPLNSIHLNLKDLCLLFELRNSGQLFGDKTIGDVRVPLSEMIQSGTGGVVRFVSYEVRNSEGKHNGILNFSYKVIGNNNSNVSLNHDNITGYQHYHHHEYHDQQLVQSHEHCTNSDIPVMGYHHHHNQGTYSEINMIGYHNHNHVNESDSVFDSDKIQYPKIDLEEYNIMASAPPLVYPPPPPPPPPSSSYSLTATTAAHYHPPAPAVYPPPPPQTWAPSHYPPPPPTPQHYVYPPPPPQPQPYGDPHWGYQRPSGYHHW